MRSLLLVAGILAGFIAFFSSSAEEQQPANPSPQTKKFADFGFMAPHHGYTGRVFKLSQAYPQTLPDKSRLPGFFKIDFKTKWKEYLLAVRDYCFKRNLRDGDVEDDWNVADECPNEWFHMPWQHFGPNGREGIHGLTKEAEVKPRQLAWSQTDSGRQTYAVAVFNEFGGYTIGRVWADHDRPDAHKAEFPDGTVICKVLFTDVPTEQVPSLGNPLQWHAYITDTFSSSRRSIHEVSLIQMDVMVRDPQSPYGWLFGTFQYNGNLNQKNKWYNLAPVGLQWGDDQNLADDDSNAQPVRTRINPKIRESAINDDEKELPPTHLGWNGRLNGPVDNPMSSCMSCHATAQAPAKSPLNPLFQDSPPPPGSLQWMRWFHNYKCGERFDKDKPTSSTDFSLQLAQSLQNFYQWHNDRKGLSAERYKNVKGPAHTTISYEHSPFMIQTIDPEDGEVFKIRRDFESK
jgi:hypothetical protein